MRWAVCRRAKRVDGALRRKGAQTDAVGLAEQSAGDAARRRNSHASKPRQTPRRSRGRALESSVAWLRTCEEDPRSPPLRAPVRVVSRALSVLSPARFVSWPETLFLDEFTAQREPALSTRHPRLACSGQGRPSLASSPPLSRQARMPKPVIVIAGVVREFLDGGFTSLSYRLQDPRLALTLAGQRVRHWRSDRARVRNHTPHRPHRTPRRRASRAQTRQGGRGGLMTLA